MPTFDGRMDITGHSDPQKFLNWLQNMNMYFIRYSFSEAEKVMFRHHETEWTIATFLVYEHAHNQVSLILDKCENFEESLISVANKNLVCYEGRTQW